MALLLLTSAAASINIKVKAAKTVLIKTKKGNSRGKVNENIKTVFNYQRSWQNASLYELNFSEIYLSGLLELL